MTRGVEAANAICPDCGADLASASLDGACPHCLMKIVLAPDELPGGEGEDRNTSAAIRRVGAYELIRQIGTGGMGNVYEARRVTDGARFALKLIRDFHTTSAAGLRRFTIEAEATARLDHPDIIKIHEVGESDGQPFLVMDYVDGKNLNEALGERDPGSSNDSDGARQYQRSIARLVARIAHAVEHAHSRGVLHRDLKPSNILIDGSGNPHLADFGLAKILETDGELLSLTGTGAAVGTPSYMSPEQVLKGNVGPATDVYSLGAILYKALTGCPVFRGTTPLETFKQIAGEPPQPPGKLNPRIDSDLETICLKCLEKDPNRRYASAELLANDLERYVSGKPVLAKRATIPRRVSQWVVQNPTASVFVASLLVGLAISLILLKVVNDQRRDIELDRDQAFDDSMSRVSQLWRDPETRSVAISARELAILAGSTPVHTREARHQLHFAVRANDSPSSMAQRYARLLTHLQKEVTTALGEPVVFHLRLLRESAEGAELESDGQTDFRVLNVTEFLSSPSAVADRIIARASNPRDVVLFTRTNTLAATAELSGRRVAVPDDLALIAATKAALGAAGLSSTTVRLLTGAPEDAAVTDLLLRRECDAGVLHRGTFERQKYRGLSALSIFPETPDVLVARQGMDPRLLAAIRQALRSKRTSDTWPETKFSVVDQPQEWLQAQRAVSDAVAQFDVSSRAGEKHARP